MAASSPPRRSHWRSSPPCSCCQLRQRAVLILRDVLGFHAAEVADMLNTTHESVTSALKRARATLAARSLNTPPAPPPRSAAEEQLVVEFTRAFQTADIHSLVSLLTRDIAVTMPPMPFEYQGRDVASRFLRQVVLRPGVQRRLVPTRANCQPALAVYLNEPHTDVAHANGLLVLTLADAQISGITRFDAGVFSRFGLPRTVAKLT